MTATVDEATPSGSSADGVAPSPLHRDRWTPDGRVAVSESSAGKVADYLADERTTEPPDFGRSEADFLAVEYLRDGVFSRDDTESLEKIRRIAKIAYEAEHGVAPRR